MAVRRSAPRGWPSRLKPRLGKSPAFRGLGRALHGCTEQGDASLQPEQLPAVVCCVSPNGARHIAGAQGFNPPRRRAAEDPWWWRRVPGGSRPRATGPDNASPGSWLSLEPQWLPANRPQCGGRKKKQLCFAQSLAINQVSISLRSRFTYPKCTRQFLLPCKSPGTLRLRQGFLRNFV